MARMRLLLGILFAAPVTIVTGLFYILPFWALGWYRYVGVHTAKSDKSALGTGWVWLLNAEKAPKFVLNYWRDWSGHCVGSTVVLRNDPFAPTSKSKLTLEHELHHVHQMHRLGFFQPLLYAMSSVTAWIAGERYYASNHFEVAARRAAGQIADAPSFAQGYTYCRNSGGK